jgi:hypothetical protein
LHHLDLLPSWDPDGTWPRRVCPPHLCLGPTFWAVRDGRVRVAMGRGSHKKDHCTQVQRLNQLSKDHIEGPTGASAGVGCVTLGIWLGCK